MMASIQFLHDEKIIKSREAISSLHRAYAFTRNMSRLSFWWAIMESALLTDVDKFVSSKNTIQISLLG